MKDIPGYEGLYAITEDGRVWSYPKKGNGAVSHNGKFMCNTLYRYYYVFLSKNGKLKGWSIHRLLATVYIPNPNNLPIVMHLDNNPHNNNLTNLRWGTYKENNQQAHDEGRNLCTDRAREKRRMNCLKFGKPVLQLTKEGILCRIYSSASDAGRITGIARQSIGKCANKNTRLKNAGGYLWEWYSENGKLKVGK